MEFKIRVDYNSEEDNKMTDVTPDYTVYLVHIEYESNENLSSLEIIFISKSHV